MSENEGFAARWRHLRQHPAFQAAAVYLGGSWAIIQVADIFIPNPAVVRWVGIILAVGFLAVVGGAWVPAAQQSAAGRRKDAPGEASTPARRRRRHFAYAAAIGLVAIGGVFWWLRPNILGAVEPDAQVIAVLPFNTSGPAVEYLSEGIVDLVSPSLDAVGAIRTVDSRTVLHRWRQRAVGGSLDLDGALAVGRDVDAGSVLLGSVITAGPDVRLTAQLFSVRGTELAQATVEGPADSVLALVDELALSLLREIWIAREPVPNLRVAGITTDNVDAIRAYLRGQQYYRESNWDSALVAFSEAVNEDSTFALAHYRLGLTYGWNIQHGGFGSGAARRHAELAQRYSDRLPARERTLVRAHALFEDASVAAHDTMQRYVQENPDDPEGWYMLGDVRYHALPLLALDKEQIFGPFDRVLELDPSLAPAFIHPLELSLAYDDSARYYHYLAAMDSVVEPSYVEPFKLVAATWEEPDSLGVRMAAHPRAQRMNGFVLTGLYRSDSRSPEPMLEVFGEAVSAMQGPGRTSSLGMYAVVLSSLGHLGEAQTVFDTVQAAAPYDRWAYMRLIPILAGYADSAFAGPVLEAMANSEVPPELDQVSHFARMLFALSRGRSAEARRYADRAVAAERGPTNDLTQLIEAGRGWAIIIDGDTVAGLEQMRSGLEEAGYASGSMEVSGPLRFALAAIQASREETRAEGIRRLRNSYWFADFAYYAPSYFLLGQALEESGDLVGAARAYEQLIRLWENADPELQPRVDTARRALERLTAETIN
jgi:tetratricopeptide (TPR) repeat protein